MGLIFVIKIISPGSLVEYQKWGKWDLSSLSKTAFTIYGILFGSQVNSQLAQQRYIIWNYPALTPGAKGDDITLLQGSNVSGDKEIKGHTLHVPDDADHNGVIARFTLTYHDVFGRKYASIYDYHSQIGWINVDHFSDVEYDLYELDQQTPGTIQTKQHFYLAGKRAQSC